jgi:hypothetical protein
MGKRIICASVACRLKGDQQRSWLPQVKQSHIFHIHASPGSERLNIVHRQSGVGLQSLDPNFLS